MDNSISLKKFLKPKMTSAWIGIVILALAIVAASRGFSGDTVGIVCFVILLVFAIALICISIFAVRNYSKEMKRLDEEGTYEQMENDFSYAAQFFGGKLRLSDDYIYPKYGGMARRYEDITKVYQYIHKTNGVENERELRVETTAGKIVTLSKIALRGKDDDEVNRAVAALLEKNPSIHLGYK